MISPIKWQGYMTQMSTAGLVALCAAPLSLLIIPVPTNRPLRWSLRAVELSVGGILVIRTDPSTKSTSVKPQRGDLFVDARAPPKDTGAPKGRHDRGRFSHELHEAHESKAQAADAG